MAVILNFIMRERIVTSRFHMIGSPENKHEPVNPVTGSRIIKLDGCLLSAIDPADHH